MAECVQRVLFHRRVLASVSTNRFLKGAASFPAAAKAFRKMSACALRGLECLSFVLVEMLDSLRCLPERQRRFRRSSRVDAFRRDRRLPASVFETRSSVWAAIGSLQAELPAPTPGSRVVPAGPLLGRSR